MRRQLFESRETSRSGMGWINKGQTHYVSEKRCLIWDSLECHPIHDCSARWKCNLTKRLKTYGDILEHNNT